VFVTGCNADVALRATAARSAVKPRVARTLRARARVVPRRVKRTRHVGFSSAHATCVMARRLRSTRPRKRS